MKTAEEWLTNGEYDAGLTQAAFVELIQRIQRDALEAAAKICDEMAKVDDGYAGEALAERIRELKPIGEPVPW